MARLRLLGMLVLVAGFVGVGVFNLAGTVANAQTKVEICDNGVDDDDDKLVDCKDVEDCKCEEPPKEGPPCSPGYWKNHTAAFAETCVQVSGWTCADLYTAITCKGSNASCRRQEAASALNAIDGCTED